MKESEVIVIGNLIFFGMFMYVVFVLGYSGWWMLLPVFIHFGKSDFKNN